VLWTLLAVIDGCAAEPWCSILSSHLGLGAGDGTADGAADEHRIGRRYAAAEHLRDLFRSYSAHRPAMLVDWAGGRDTDGAGAVLDPDLQWQAELWRRLRSELACPSPAERLDEACARLRDEPATSGLPERWSVFGATRITTEQRAVLTALGEHREVHLWLPHPSPVMWQSVATSAAAGPRRREVDASSCATPCWPACPGDAGAAAAAAGRPGRAPSWPRAPRRC
jgi:exodeoxyribonuclease V gamma subunit